MASTFTSSSRPKRQTYVKLDERSLLGSSVNLFEEIPLSDEPQSSQWRRFSFPTKLRRDECSRSWSGIAIIGALVFVAVLAAVVVVVVKGASPPDTAPSIPSSPLTVGKTGTNISNSDVSTSHQIAPTALTNPSKSSKVTVVHSTKVTSTQRTSDAVTETDVTSPESSSSPTSTTTPETTSSVTVPKLSTVAVLPKRTSTRRPIQDSSQWSSCGTPPHVRLKRVVKGRQVREGEVPWMVMLLKDGDFHCGGSVLNSTHILTAAHCVQDHQGLYHLSSGANFLNREDIEVIAGKLRTRLTGQHRTVGSSEQRVSVDRIIQHPDYNDHTNDNDVAILVLETELTLTEWVRPICLPDPDNSLPDSANVAGWGSIMPSMYKSFNGGWWSSTREPEVLQETTLSVYDPEQCRVKFRNARANSKRKITDGMMCALDENPPSPSSLSTRPHGSDSCQGDSGGPLYAIPAGGQSYVQFGIVSWGYGCGVPGEPGYYTYIPHYIPWIRNILSGHNVTSS
ncbi:hypothetical protein BaRGS_00026733 [Batillaria attramentaria]|uniref:Peptidase S1 domain-containing protein n=1 Tax=Batillaria attramentaria TaxID=370345 RepID=A0ABD0K5D4_9CAEN